VSSRALALLIPFFVIAGFWLWARYESKQGHDPTHKSYWERNGTVLGVVFIGLVAFWTLLLVTLPYLYMVVESFHPRLAPAQRGGPDDFLTIAQYKSFFVSPSDNEWNWVHMSNFIYTIFVSSAVTFINLCICYPLAY
jgi:spermidine/putrescine transport system permease protein